MLKNNSEQLAINKAVLKAVRKLSGFSFNKSLGDYSLTFELQPHMKAIDIALRNTEYGFESCFIGYFDGITTSANISFPKSITEIPKFENEIEAVIAQVNKFIQSGGK